MIPILYDKYETAFTSNGLGRLADCISCTVTEERNGIYECQFTYPVTGEMFPEIQEGRIIAVIHDDAKDIQPFDIYGHSAPLNGVVTFYAHHISYRLGSVILKPMVASSCAATLADIPNNTYNPCPFTFWTDKSVSASWENKVPSAVKAILGGQRGSILDVYGKGEYKWDKFLVRLYVNRGNDNGVSIRYGVNLTDLKQDYDESGSYNAVAPYWVNSEDGTVVTLTKGIVAVNAETRLVPWTTQSGEEITDRAGNPIYFEVGVPVATVPMDLSEAFETQPTEAQLEAEALRRLNSSEAWLPSENITVKFINLADTEEYRNVAALQRVSLCDRVSVYCGPLNVSAVKMQVIRVVYNVLTERYDEIELGKAKTSFAQTITAQVEELTKDLPTTSMMQRAINNATDKITGAMGGHVRFIYDANGEMQEILIMDTDDINTAVKVWRWNSGGLGYSSNGYNGPYTLAMTQDGAIVADFIKAGEMSFNRLRGGTLYLGGANNTDGSMHILDSNNTLIGQWDNAGINIYKGSIRGPDIYLGGNNGQFGAMYIYNLYGQIVGRWDRAGIYIGSGYLDFGTLTINKDGYALVNTYTVSDAYTKSVTLSAGTLKFTANYNVGINESILLDSVQGLVLRSNDDGSSMNPRVQISGSNSAYGTTITRDSIEIVSNDGWGLFDVDSDGNLYASGTKSRRVTTDQYSDRLLYCYETPTPMFGDIGEGVIGEDGLCYVAIDPVFAQTITTDRYQVFLQAYDDGTLFVNKRYSGYFIVQGTPGMAFGWEIKAKQRDFDQRRLDSAQKPYTPEHKNYGAEAAQYIEQLRKEREAA